jgi:5'-phosphate synthase pdxT subunit
MTTIGILALQGDFAEHEAMIRRLDVDARQVRSAGDLKGLDGLILPGGESTTFCKLMQDFDLYEPLAAVARSGVPTWGTCAGMIVLANHASDLAYPTLQAIDIEVSRNAYGRQVESFESDVDIAAIGAPPFHCVFIRAPVVLSVGPNVEVLATATDGFAPESPVAVRQGSLIATSFHPELTGDDRLHRYFLDIVRSSESSGVGK